MENSQPASSESAIQKEVAILEDSINAIDKKKSEILDKLQPILAVCPPTAEEEKKPIESTGVSPLLNDLTVLKNKTNKIVCDFQELLQRIQC